MRVRSSMILLFVALAVPSVLSCASGAWRQGEKADRLPLSGMVYDFESRPVSEALISVDGKAIARSDINGRFSLGSLSFGSYRVAASKQGFETTSLDVRYEDAAQIVYMKMYSSRQLVALAEKEAASRNWDAAISSLDRVDALGAKDPEARYLRAAILARTGKAQDAKAILESLLAEKYDEPFVHLFLADIAQYSLGDSASAISNLEKYLQARYDPDAEERLRKLKE
jgi:hypothetical protein